MSRFSIKICAWVLLVVHHIVGTLSDEMINFDFHQNTEIKSCRAGKLSTSVRKICSISVNRESRIEPVYMCRCSIPNSIAYYGEWQVIIFPQASNKRPVIENIVVYNAKVVKLLPGNSFFRKIDQSVRVYLNETFDDDKPAYCYAYRNGKMMYNLSSTINDETVELYGKCGIQIIVTNNAEGEWSIHNDYEYDRKTASFTLVIDRKNYDTVSLPTLPNEMIGQDVEILTKVHEMVLVPIPKPPVHNSVKECYAFYNDVKYQFYPTENNEIIGYRGLHASCEFGIYNMTKEYYGKWTVVTVYDKKPRGTFVQSYAKIVDNVYIYPRISRELNPSGSTVITKNKAIDVMVSSTPIPNATCRLVHKTSNKQYDLTANVLPTPGITANKIVCGASIIFEEKRWGEWFIEDCYKNIIRRTNFFIFSLNDH